MPLENIRHIQRLKKPTDGNRLSFHEPCKNSGFSQKSADYLKQIFELDIMCAAEFEFGEVPDALAQIKKYANPGNGKKKQSNMSTGSFEIDQSGTNVYYLCESELEQDIVSYICQQAICDYNPYLKKQTHFKDALSGKTNVCGWLVLEPAFMFFLDEKMYKDTLEYLTGSHSNKYK